MAKTIVLLYVGIITLVIQIIIITVKNKIVPNPATILSLVQLFHIYFNLYTRDSSISHIIISREECKERLVIRRFLIFSSGFQGF
jgi:uncharacterized membrane protein